MLFLKPVFCKLQSVYEIYAPVLFTRVQKKMEDFFPSKSLIFFIFHFRINRVALFNRTIRFMDDVLVDNILFYTHSPGF